MKRFKGSEKSPKGMYLNLSSIEFIQVNEETGVLPGESDTTYIKVPLIFAMIAGPFAGLIFILFLPFVGLASIIGFLGYQLWKTIHILLNKTVQLASFSWQPGKAYFNPGQEKSIAGSDEIENELDEINEKVEKLKRKEGS